MCRCELVDLLFSFELVFIGLATCFFWQNWQHSKRKWKLFTHKTQRLMGYTIGIRWIGFSFSRRAQPSSNQDRAKLRVVKRRGVKNRSAYPPLSYITHKSLRFVCEWLPLPLAVLPVLPEKQVARPMKTSSNENNRPTSSQRHIVRLYLLFKI